MTSSGSHSRLVMNSGWSLDQALSCSEGHIRPGTAAHGCLHGPDGVWHSSSGSFHYFFSYLTCVALLSTSFLLKHELCISQHGLILWYQVAPESQGLRTCKLVPPFAIPPQWEVGVSSAQKERRTRHDGVLLTEPEITHSLLECVNE